MQMAGVLMVGLMAALATALLAMPLAPWWWWWMRRRMPRRRDGAST
jgi:hypothetical protein